MKCLFCAHCRGFVPLHHYHTVSCFCGKCYGKYVSNIGQAVFTELFTDKPADIWVFGISNDLLDDKKPNYKRYKTYFTQGKQFRQNKTMIIKVRPRKTFLDRFSKTDCVFLKQKDFFKLFPN